MCVAKNGCVLCGWGERKNGGGRERGKLNGMVWVRKKARLRSWRVGLGLGLVGERRNYNCIHYYLDRCKKPPPKKKNT